MVCYVVKVGRMSKAEEASTSDVYPLSRKNIFSTNFYGAGKEANLFN